MIKFKSTQFELYQRELETAMNQKVDERIKNEKCLWEQEQSYLIRKEMSKLSEEKSKELAALLEELDSEREKLTCEKNRSVKLEQVLAASLLKL